MDQSVQGGAGQPGQSPTESRRGGSDQHSGGICPEVAQGYGKSGFRKAVPAEDHERTLLFFGADQTFKDVLRCHNTCTGYVFLLDGVGRIRWAGSGKPTDEEMRTLIEVAKELTPVANASNAKLKSKQRMSKR